MDMRAWGASTNGRHFGSFEFYQRNEHHFSSSNFKRASNAFVNMVLENVTAASPVGESDHRRSWVFVLTKIKCRLRAFREKQRSAWKMGKKLNCWQNQRWWAFRQQIFPSDFSSFRNANLPAKIRINSLRFHVKRLTRSIYLWKHFPNYFLRKINTHESFFKCQIQIEWIQDYQCA